MSNSLFEQWRAEAQAMVDNAVENSKESKNKVFINIDSVGAIKALVFGKAGVVSVEPCYDDQEAGKYAHRLAYPNIKKLKQIFTEKTGVAEFDFDDDAFIEFVQQEMEEQAKGAEWNGVSWDHTYSRYKGILYDSKQDAVSAIWSEDVFCGIPKDKNVEYGTSLSSKESELAGLESARKEREIKSKEVGNTQEQNPGE